MGAYRCCMAGCMDRWVGGWRGGPPDGGLLNEHDTCATSSCINNFLTNEMTERYQSLHKHPVGSLAVSKINKNITNDGKINKF